MTALPTTLPAGLYEAAARRGAPPRQMSGSRPSSDAIPPPPLVEYAKGEGEVGGRDGRYYQYRDITWGPGVVRMHRFLTGKEGGGVKPVYGLTA